MENKVIDAFMGLAIGDALGVPFELVERQVLEKDPVTDMVGYKAHNKPVGTWSDDGAMTFCMAESLLKGFDVERMGKNFLAWFDDGYWSADGKAFGSGGTTRAALKKIREGTSATQSGSSDPDRIGNGALMRMIPLAFYLEANPSDHYDVWNKVRAASSITHAQGISCIACFYYVMFARNLMRGKSPLSAYAELKKPIRLILHILRVEQRFITQDDIRAFDRLLEFGYDLSTLPPSEIRSDSYVVHSLEASIWCLLTSTSYKETVLKAVNLGGDSDSTAAISGALAAIAHGLDDVPQHWIDSISRKNDIIAIAMKMNATLNKDVRMY